MLCSSTDRLNIRWEISGSLAGTEPLKFALHTLWSALHLWYSLLFLSKFSCSSHCLHAWLRASTSALSVYQRWQLHSHFLMKSLVSQLTSHTLWSHLKSWYNFWQPEGEACSLAYKTFWHWYAPFQGFSCCKQGICLLRSFFLVALRYKMNVSSHSFHTINANSGHSTFC